MSFLRLVIVMKRKNDIEAFTQTVEECQGILFKICLMFTHRGSDDIRDLYQDIVCKLWEGWSSSIDRRAVSSWVYRVRFTRPSTSSGIGRCRCP